MGRKSRPKVDKHSVQTDRQRATTFNWGTGDKENVMRTSNLEKRGPLNGQFEHVR